MLYDISQLVAVLSVISMTIGWFWLKNDDIMSHRHIGKSDVQRFLVVRIPWLLCILGLAGALLGLAGMRLFD